MTFDSGDAWLDAINQREQLLGETTVRRMAEIFVEEVDGLLARAQAALSEGKTAVARKEMHDLGGNAGCLDFNDLAATALEAERDCDTGNSRKALERLAEITPLAHTNAAQLRHRFHIP